MSAISNIRYGLLPTATSFFGSGNDQAVDCDGLGLSMVAILTIGDFRDATTGEILVGSTGERNVLVDESEDGSSWSQVAAFADAIIRFSNARTSHQLLFARTKRYVRTRQSQGVFDPGVIVGVSTSFGDVT